MSLKNRFNPNKHFNSPESTVEWANSLLQAGNFVSVLELFRDTPYKQSHIVNEFMQGFLFVNKSKLPRRLLDESFIDSLFCQCDICDRNWLLPPITYIANIRPENSSIGLKCPSCGRVVCSDCAKITGIICRCGKKFNTLNQPNGRKRRVNNMDDKILNLDDYELPDTPLATIKDLHLFYGFDGKIPIGIDATFPSKQTTSITEHIQWAIDLFDAGIYYQSQQQIDLLKQKGDTSSQANWLRARLELVKLINSRERSHKKIERILFTPNWVDILAKANYYLDRSMALNPDFGPAWLLSAELCLENWGASNFELALQRAEHAEILLGNMPAVLLIKARALRGLIRLPDAIDLLRQIPEDAPEYLRAQEELDIAELEANYLLVHKNPVKYLKLGRIYFRSNQYEKAKGVFQDLLNLWPSRPEGYYGLAKFAFIDPTKKQSERLNEAYRLCKDSLSHDPNFGLAYELLGSIFQSMSYSKEPASFPVEDPLDCFRRAVDLDTTCDLALWILGDNYINQGNLNRAIEMLEKAAALKTTYSSVYFLLSEIYFSLRQFEKHSVAYKRAKELSPDTNLSPDYQEKIQNLCNFQY